jgi:glyoxylase-like metal-dependent hydrolase (beta-lactamase superfamily II)
VITDPARRSIEPVVTASHVPAGVLGPEPVTIEVRCFVVPTANGIVVVDTGIPGTAELIEAALGRVGARWADVTDIVLTHAHFDHVGGLAEAVIRAPQATLRAGALDLPDIRLDDDSAIRPLVEGDRVRDLLVLDTPGHTPGHISLLHEAASLVLIGDLVGSVDGKLSFGPAAFTADAAGSRASLRRVAGLGIERLVFSHGAEVSDPNGAVADLLGAAE